MNTNKTLLYLTYEDDVLLYNYIHNQGIKDGMLYSIRSNKSKLIGFSNDNRLIDLLKDEDKGHEILYMLNKLLEDNEPYDDDTLLSITKNRYGYEENSITRALYNSIDRILPGCYKFELFGRTIYLYYNIQDFIDSLKEEYYTTIENTSYTVRACSEPIVDSPYIKDSNNSNNEVVYTYYHKELNRNTYFYITFNDLNFASSIDISDDDKEKIVKGYLSRTLSKEECLKNFKDLFTTNKREIIIYIKEVPYNDQGIPVTWFNGTNNSSLLSKVINPNNIVSENIQFGIIEDFKGSYKYLYFIESNDIDYLMTRIEYAPLIKLNNIVRELLHYAYDDNYDKDELNKDDYIVRFIRLD